MRATLRSHDGENGRRVHRFMAVRARQGLLWCYGGTLTQAKLFIQDFKFHCVREKYEYLEPSVHPSFLDGPATESGRKNIGFRR